MFPDVSSATEVGLIIFALVAAPSSPEQNPISVDIMPGDDVSALGGGVAITVGVDDDGGVVGE
jgi:hypothetical protein